MKGGCFFCLNPSELVRLPRSSELFLLPGRSPVGFDRGRRRFRILDNLNAVAAFASPGYTATYNSAYAEKSRTRMLPLFSYGAAVFLDGEFYIAATRVDRELRQDFGSIDAKVICRKAREFGRLFSANRLVRHLQKCALTYGCPAAKNFFLSRYEAPLPTSPRCNARCAGCISYQPEGRCPVTQPRIAFTPSPEEVAEVALFHIEKAPDPVVSFGQGCEGEPLLVFKVLRDSIRLIRKKTSRGVINLNTNASEPEKISRLFDAGLDSIRVSINSLQEIYYMRYYNPKGYSFRDVLDSTRIAKKKGGFVSLNYLVMPGFTDSKDEFTAFRRFLEKSQIDMIQWRNMNFDPMRYFEELRFEPDAFGMIGMRELIGIVRKDFPSIMMGYFNPSRGRIARHAHRRLR